MELRPDATWTFDTLVVASIGTGHGGWRITGVVYRNGTGSATMLCNPVVTVMCPPTGFTATPAATVLGNALVINAVVSAGTNIKWVATTRTAEVVY